MKLLAAGASFLALTVSVASAQDFKSQIEQAGDRPEAWRAIRENALAKPEGIQRLMQSLAMRVGRPSPVPAESANQVRQDFARLREAFESSPHRTKEAAKALLAEERTALVTAYVIVWLDMGEEFIPQIKLATGDGMLLSRIPDTGIDKLIEHAQDGSCALAGLALHRSRKARENWWAIVAKGDRRGQAESYSRSVEPTASDLEIIIGHLELNPKFPSTFLTYLAFNGRGTDLKRLRALSYDDPMLKDAQLMALAGSGDDDAAKEILAQLAAGKAMRPDMAKVVMIHGAAPSALKYCAESWPKATRDERFGMIPWWIETGDPAALEAGLTVLGENDIAPVARVALRGLLWKRADLVESILPRALDAFPGFADVMAAETHFLASTAHRVALMDALLALAEKNEKHRAALLRMFCAADPWEIGFELTTLDDAKAWWAANRAKSATRGW